MKDRMNFDVGEKVNGDRVHIFCNNTDAQFVVETLDRGGIEIYWNNSYGLSKLAKRKIDKLREKYE